MTTTAVNDYMSNTMHPTRDELRAHVLTTTGLRYVSDEEIALALIEWVARADHYTVLEIAFNLGIESEYSDEDNPSYGELAEDHARIEGELVLALAYAPEFSNN